MRPRQRVFFCAQRGGKVRPPLWGRPSRRQTPSPSRGEAARAAIVTQQAPRGKSELVERRAARNSFRVTAAANARERGGRGPPIADGYRPTFRGWADGKPRTQPEAGRGEGVLERRGRSRPEGAARSVLATSEAPEAARPKTPSGSLERAIASECCYSER